MSRQLPAPWNWPGGINISNFNGTPGMNQQIRTIGSVSGVTTSNILISNGNIGGRQNKIIVSPDHTRVGDSGAALIRVSDSAVLGTLRGGTWFNGEWLGIYTSVRNY